MQHNTKAFTLIELLVVVLIIGILSAIALPQYQKAVAKSRLTEQIIQARALINAEIEYMLSAQAFATDLTALSIDFPNNSWSCPLGKHWCKSKAVKNAQLEVNCDVNSVSCKLECIAIDSADTLDDELCKSLGGTYYYDNESGTTYYKIYE